MRLTEKEYNQYYNTHPKLIYYVGITLNLLSEGVSLEEFMDFSVEEKYPIREALYENIKLIDNYIESHGSQNIQRKK
jgi:hypothetical protein